MGRAKFGNLRTDLPRRNAPRPKFSNRNENNNCSEDDIQCIDDGEVKAPVTIPPLSDNERKAKKQERNKLFKQLLKNRNEETTTQATVSVVTPIAIVTPTNSRNQKQKDMSPLENLFNIIQTNKAAPKSAVRVTSSSSRCSSSSTGGRRKKVKKSINRKTDSSQLHELSPQERLVKKVQETLRNENKEKEEAKDIVRQSSQRKKVIFRKRKDEEVTKLPRTGRHFRPGSSQIKSVKVRVRRIDEIPPFPIVY